MKTPDRAASGCVESPPSPHRARLTWPVIALVLGTLLTAPGCGTMENGRGWGQDAIYPVDWGRLPRAAKRALLDPATYLPAAGALVFAIDDFDERTSDWAVEHTPIFGSVEGAKDASDILRQVLVVDAFGTAAITPSGDQPGSWLLSKARGAGVEAVAWQASLEARSGLQHLIHRERPDGSGDNSFPSGHATGAFSTAALANRNLNFIEMPSMVRTSLKAVNFAMASGVAWARVEGQKHYPSDVLAGAALGNFLTVLIHDTFTGLPEDRLQFFVQPNLEGAGVSVSFDF